MIILYDRDFKRVDFLSKNIIKMSYQKHRRQLWEASVTLLASEEINNKIKPYYFMELTDGSGEQIGVFRVAPKDIKVSKDGSTITYKLYHALHTLYDTVIMEDDITGGDIDLMFESLLDRQAKKYWKFGSVPANIYMYDYKIQAQNGLLSTFFDLVNQLGEDCYPVFNTTTFPWTVSIASSAAITARIKEGYTMSSFGINKDPTTMYNRLYPIGERETYKHKYNDKEFTDAELKAKQDEYAQYEKDKAEYEKKRKEMTAAREAESARRKKLTEERSAKIKRLKAAGSKEKVPPLKFGDLPPAASTLKAPVKPDDPTIEQTRGNLYIHSVNNGLKYIQNDALVEEYGPIEYYKKFDTEDPNELLRLGKEYFQYMQLMSTSVTCTVMDLKEMIDDPLVIDRIRLGQKIYFETEEFGQMEMYVTDEGKQDAIGKPEDITIGLSINPKVSEGSGGSSSVNKEIIKNLGEQATEIQIVRETADGKNTVTTSVSPPENPRIGDIWFFQTIDPETGLPMTRMRKWNGVQWVDLLDEIDAAMKVVDDNQLQLETMLEELDVESERLDYEAENAQKDLVAIQEEVVKVQGDIKDSLATVNNTIKEINQNADILKESVDENTGKLTTLANTTQQNSNKITSIEETNTGINTTLGKVVRDQSGLATKVSDYKKEVDAYNEKATQIYKDLDPANTDPNSTGFKLTQISQKATAIEAQLSSFAKKTDLTGLATEEYVNTTAKAEAGKIQTSLSSQITTVNTKVNEIKSRPTYTIGSDGYWYKDGVKTSTKALGKDGAPGKDGTDGKDGTSVTIKGTIPSGGKLPATGNEGDGYLRDGDLYVWDGSQWGNVGRIQGPPGKQGIQGIPGKDGLDGEGFSWNLQTQTQTFLISHYNNQTFDILNNNYTIPNTNTTSGWIIEATLQADVTLGAYVRFTTEDLDIQDGAVLTWSMDFENLTDEPLHLATNQINNNTNPNKWMKVEPGWSGRIHQTFEYSSSNITQVQIISTTAGKKIKFAYGSPKLEVGEARTTSWSPSREESKVNNYVWNMLKGGAKPIINSTKYLCANYPLTEDIPDGSMVTFTAKVKGHRPNNNIGVINTGNDGGSVQITNYAWRYVDSSTDWTYLTVCGKWRAFNSQGDKLNSGLKVYWGWGDSGDREPVSIEWAYLVYGVSNQLEYIPTRAELQGADGKDAYMYQGEEPPEDTKQMWYNPKTGITSVYYNGAWRDVNTKINEKLNNVTDTVDAHTRTISAVQTDLKTKATTAQLSEVKQTTEGLTSTVSSLSGKVNLLDGTQKTQATQLSTFQQKLDGFSTTVSSLKTNIDKTNDRLSQGGDVYTMITKAQQTADGFSSSIQKIQGELDNLQIGGRNYIRHSDVLLSSVWKKDPGASSITVSGSTVEFNNTTGTTDLLGSAQLLEPESPFFEKDEVLTLSFDAENLSTKSVKLGTQYLALNPVHHAYPDVGPKQKMRVKITGKAQWQEPVLIVVRRLPTSTSAGQNYTIRITNVKLEKGNQATDWTPAPEDLDQSSLVTQFNTFKRTVDQSLSILGDNSTGLISKINQQAGRILFEVTESGTNKGAKLSITKDGAVMDRAFIQNAHIADGSITNAKISSLSASKINTGTLNASNVTITNLSANRITSGTLDCSRISVKNLTASDIRTGTLRGTYGYWDLDDGTFFSGNKYYSAIKIYDGTFTVQEYARSSSGSYGLIDFLGIDKDGITFYDKATGGGKFGYIGYTKWRTSGYTDFNLAHTSRSSMGIAYRSTSDMHTYYNYILFDHYNTSGNLRSDNYQIQMEQSVYFTESALFYKGMVLDGKLRFAGSNMGIEKWSDGILFGNTSTNNGLYVSSGGTIYKMTGGSISKIH